MPSTDTGDFPETLVCLPRQLLHTPTVRDALETMTLGDSNDIDTFILLEHGADLDRLFKQASRELDFIRN